MGTSMLWMLSAFPMVVVTAQPAATLVFFTVQDKPTLEEISFRTEAPTDDFGTESPTLLLEEDALRAGAATAAPSEVVQVECDPMETKFAPACCPLTDEMYEEFCVSLFNRPLYISSGMIEAHEPWINPGGYNIAHDPYRRRRNLRRNFAEAVKHLDPSLVEKVMHATANKN